MKYVVVKKKSYWFQKGIPTNLQSTAGKKKFVKPLDLKVGEASSVDVEKARLRELENFSLYIKSLQNSDPSAFSQDELNKAAIALLKDKKIKPGSIPADIADFILDEIDDVPRDEASRTFQDNVVVRAYRAVSDAKVLQERTLNSLINIYQSNRTYETTRDKNRDDFRWNQFISITGNHILSKGLIDIVHDGLDQYAEQRLVHVKPSTVQRELNTICAVLNLGNRKYRLSWNITKPELPKFESALKQVLTQEDQRKLISYCRSDDTSPEVSSTIILMLQGGMMPSEVKRLSEDSICLTSVIPHLIIKSKTKTVSRKRIIPIVLEKDYVNNNINRAISWLNRTTDTNHSARIKKVITTAINKNGYSGHCLRHTFRNNAVANSADLGKASLIAGWSTAGGLSSQMLTYGSEGLAQSEVLKGLWSENLKIHRHLIDL